MPRIRDPLPADYANLTFSASASSATPSAGGRERSDSVLPSLLFGSKSSTDAESTSKSSSAGAEAASYHDNRFMKVLDSCEDSLSESCKKKLLQAYKVSLSQFIYLLSLHFLAVSSSEYVLFIGLL